MAKCKRNEVMKCVPRGSVVIPREHLREDIREARSGIRRDEQALGGLGGLGSSPPEHMEHAQAEHVTGTHVISHDGAGRVRFDEWFPATAWNNRRLGWPDDATHVTRVTLVKGGQAIASRLVYPGEGVTSRERSAAGLPPSEWGFPPMRMEFGPEPVGTNYWSTSAPQPAAPGLNGLAGLDDAPEVHAREYQTAVKYSRQGTKTLRQSLREALDPANGTACSDAFEEATDLINNRHAEYIHFFAANPGTEEMPPSAERSDARAALKEFAQKCLIPKAKPSRGPWYKRAFKRGR